MLNSKYWTEYHNKKMTAEEALSHIKTGDVIEIRFGEKAVRVEVLDVQETVKKDEAKELYRYL